ncbi:MAG: 3-hydroxyacyl-CoA dehydrogenase NAD-binding domain-containing protein [Anaerolineales bacterium]
MVFTSDGLRIGIVGVGAIGSGVAQLVSSLGAETVIVSPREGGVERARSMMKSCYWGDVERGRISEQQAEEGYSRLRFSSDYEDLDGSDFVIESVPENLEIKQQVLRNTQAVVGKDCIFGTNTSSIPIARIAEAADRPEVVIGTHYFWPAHRYKLVEISRAPLTSEETLSRTLDFLEWQDKTVLVVRDKPGFYTTRILLPYVNEAVALVLEGAQIEEVDSAMVDFGWAMGPFRLMDAAGLETLVNVYRFVQDELGERIAVLGSLTPLVQAGFKGYSGGSREEAKGFYRYPKGAEADGRIYKILGQEAGKSPPPEEIRYRPNYQMINEVGHCLDEGVVKTHEKADMGAVLGIGWPADKSGPIAFTRLHGPEKIAAMLETWASKHGPRFKPSRTLIELAKADSSSKAMHASQIS